MNPDETDWVLSKVGVQACTMCIVISSCSGDLTRTGNESEPSTERVASWVDRRTTAISEAAVKCAHSVLRWAHSALTWSKFPAPGKKLGFQNTVLKIHRKSQRLNVRQNKCQMCRCLLTGACHRSPIVQISQNVNPYFSERRECHLNTLCEGAWCKW